MSAAGKHIILGVTGSIAAYKAVLLLRELTTRGAEVTVVMSANAEQFVGPLTFRTLSGRPVLSSLFDPQSEDAVEHVALAERADALVVAPATANLLAKAAHGIADDFLTTLLLAARCPVLIAPAMDGGMWNHQTVVDHVRRLRARGVLVVDPGEGSLASGRFGAGRLAEEMRILEILRSVLAPKRDWQGQRLLVSAGPTQEPIDPVRYISNRSSGKMGYAIAEAAQKRGASVVLVSGPTSLAVPRGVDIVAVDTAEEMTKALCTHLSWSTVVIMTAAVADYRPRHPSSQKLKKQTRLAASLELEPTADILSLLSSQKTSQLIVGFAAETHDVLAHAKHKLATKRLDLIVANDVSKPGAGFGSDVNAAILIDRNGLVIELPLKSKRELAHDILDAARLLLPPAPSNRNSPHADTPSRGSS
jgi:phosphopantothenoylcysteine decarboxylase/phosphopantothenate--cysteine ligase